VEHENEQTLPTPEGSAAPGTQVWAGAPPAVRLHLWLERGGELYFGMGRAQLLANVQRLGSIKKAAEHMGMSYRAAWGKLQQSERALGVKLLNSPRARSEGVRLTSEAKELVAAYLAWFDAVERAAQEAGRRLLPLAPRAFEPEQRRAGASGAALPPDAPR
jgi:N-terminal domain of molybdenum-binding protein